MKHEPALPLRFSGSTNEYFRIWFVNLVLTLLTLGLYSAWAKVRKEQYFYRHTWLQEHNFDYHADPVRILRGRIVFVILVAAATLLQNYVTWTLLLVLAFGFVMTPWVMVSMLRFKAKNSSYKSIRFSFHGSTAESYKTMLVGGLVYVCTFGLGVFYWQYRLYEFVGKHHRFGDLNFRFNSKASDFFIIYLFSFFIYAALASVLVVAVVVVKTLSGNDDLFEPMAFIFLYAAAFIVEAFLKAMVTNRIWSSLVVGEHQLKSTQTFFGVLFLQLTNLLGIVFSLGLLIPWTKVRSVRYRIEHLELLPRGELFANAGAQQDVSALGQAIDDLGDFELDFL